MCGGMHTVALSPAGIAYSWGCNDEGALGRLGNEQDILPVDLPLAIDGVSVGDSHTIFYSTEKSVAYLTGLYRVSSRQIFRLGVNHKVPNFIPQN